MGPGSAQPFRISSLPFPSLVITGPNRALDQIVTRWVRDIHGALVMRAGMPLIQVLLLKRKVDGMWALPGSFREPSHGPLPVLVKVFGVETLDEKEKHHFSALQRFLESGQTIYTV